MESERLLEDETERIVNVPISFNNNHRRTRTAVLLFNAFGIGLLAAVAGTTLIQTRILYDVTTAIMSVALTLESCGCVLGVLACSLLIGRLKFEFITGFCLALSALMTICAPFLPVFPAFIAAVTIRGFGNGCSNLNSQYFCVNSWDGRKKAIVTQAQNAVWSIAATISPFIMKPFLIEVVPPSNVHNESTHHWYTNIFTESTSSNFVTSHAMSVSHLDNVTPAASSQNTTFTFYTTVEPDVTTALPEGLSEVRFAYLLIGLISIVNVVPIIFSYFYMNGVTCPCQPRQQPPNNPAPRDYGTIPEHDVIIQSGTSRWPARSAVFYVSVVFCIGILYGGLELTPRSFFTSFVVRYLSWTVHDATLLLSVFYATFGAGRLLAVPLSTVISPTIMLTFNIIFIGMGLGILLMIDFIVKLNPIFIWIGSGLVGFGLSSSYACLVLVVSTTLPEVNHQQQSLNISTILSALSIGCNVGFVLFPVLVGNLFDYRSPMWMVYVLIGAAVCEAGLLVVRRTLARIM